MDKTTCRAPSANPVQLGAHNLRSFQTIVINFFMLSEFPDLFDKVLLITFKFS